MQTDTELIPQITKLKSEGVGLFRIRDALSISLEKLLDLWDGCGPAVLSREKISYILKSVTPLYGRDVKVTLTDHALEELAFNAGASIEATRKYIHDGGGKFSAAYSKKEKVCPDMRFDPPAANIDDIPISKKMDLCGAFLNRCTEENMAKETSIPVSVCRIYRLKLQRAYTILINARGLTNLAERLRLMNAIKAQGVEYKIAEMLLHNIEKDKGNSLSTSPEYAKLFAKAQKNKF